MRIKDCFIINPTKPKMSEYQFISYFDTSSVIKGELIEVDHLESNYPSRAKRVLLQGDILYSSVRPNLRHYYFYENEYENAVGSTGFFVLRKQTNLIDERFVYYFLSSNQVVDYLSAIAEASQATFPACLPKDIAKIPLPSFDIFTQNNISNCLNKYDKQIENNRKLIATLRSISKELFLEWFVRFRYPRYHVEKLIKSDIGRVPSSFSINKMNGVIDYYVGGGWGNDDPSDLFPVEASVIRGADFPYVSNGDVSSCPKRFHKVSNYEPRQLKENDIVFEISGGTEEQPVGRSVIVTKGILKQLSNKAICASFCKLIRPDYKKVTPYFFYYWLQYLYDTRIIDRYQLQSTGITNFQFEYFLRKGFCLVPPFELMEKFDSIIGPMRKEIDDLSMMNANLKKQRDMLLPRLMSGKLDISGKEII